MWTLVLIISLTSKFNQALDVSEVHGLTSKDKCYELSKKIITELQQYNQSVQVSVICNEN